MYLFRGKVFPFIPDDLGIQKEEYAQKTFAFPHLSRISEICLIEMPSFSKLEILFCREFLRILTRRSTTFAETKFQLLLYMKKILLFLFAALSVQIASAQLPSGSQAPDFTLTDINGNTFHLADALAAGKTVFIDISATWCGPCWNYHGTGALDEVYNDNGPNGTCSNDVIVIFIEGDTTTTSADLHGTGTNTQGDWVTGTPYPIFDPTDNTVMNAYQIAYFPTIYRICPSGICDEVGQLNGKGLEASIDACGLPNDMKVEAAGGLFCDVNYTPQIRVSNITNGTLTTCTMNYSIDGGAQQVFNWNGSLAQGSSAVVNLPTVTLTPGHHSFDVTGVDPNSAVDGNRANNCSSNTINVVTTSGIMPPTAEAFSNATFPYAGWTVVNDDAGITWAHATANGGSMKYDCYDYGTVGASDDLIPAPYDLSSVSNASMTFKVAYRQYSTAYVDGLEALVSTDCGATWTSVWAKEGTALATVNTVSTSAFTPTTSQWRVECIDLNQYVGNNKVFVAFRGHNAYGNNIFVDEITMNNFVCALGIDELNSQLTEFKAYPNPTSTNATISYSLKGQAPVSLQVYNMVGERVINQYIGTQAAGNYTTQLDMSSLSSGIYLVNLNVDGVVSTLRLTVSK